MADRHQRIHLGIVGADAAVGQVEGHDGEPADLAVHAVVRIAHERHDIARLQARPLHVGRD